MTTEDHELGGRQLSKRVIDFLVTAKFHFKVANRYQKSHEFAAIAVCINSAHDALEMFIMGLAAALSVDIKKNSSFEQCFDAISNDLSNKKFSMKKLPSRSDIINFNKMRVMCKHHGIKPNYKDMELFMESIAKFFEETCEGILGVDFWKVSLINLIVNQEIKQYLESASRELDERNYLECMIECRKAIYTMFEQNSDVSSFRDGNAGKFDLFCEAPHFARSKMYIDSAVRTIFDYIVIDWLGADMKMLRIGCDPQILKNVIQLTPRVYKSFNIIFEDNSPGCILPNIKKYEVIWDWECLPPHSQHKTARENAEYVFHNTIDIAIKIEQSSQIEFSMIIPSRLLLKRDGVPIFQKANPNSQIIGYASRKDRILSSKICNGLDFLGKFYEISIPHGGPFTCGYLDINEVTGEVAGDNYKYVL